MAQLELLLCYLVSGASWRPEYDVRASSQEEDVVLTCYGAVQQKTGEDWTEVRPTAPVRVRRNASLGADLAGVV